MSVGLQCPDTLVLMPSYSGAPEIACKASLDKLRPARVLTQNGMSDVTLARNRLLTVADQYLRDHEHIRHVLCLDDDMEFEAATVAAVLKTCERLGVAVSGTYCNAEGRLAAVRWPPSLTLDKRTPDSLHPEGPIANWLCGMGLMAIPRERFLRLGTIIKAKGGLLMSETELVFPWCTSSPSPCHTYWESEDFSFSRRIGGVHLLPVAVGHLKRVPLYPDDQTLATLREGGRLPGEVPTVRDTKRVSETSVSADGQS